MALKGHKPLIICLHSLMKYLLLLALFVPFGAAAQTTETAYDSTYAARLGADDYGMKTYVMAYLKRGPNRPADKAEAARLQKAHMDNIGRLAESGKLVMAGPFLDTGAIRGIYIFDVRTIEEAAALTATDPAIQYGSLQMELHPWYGSATLIELNALHKRVQKKGF